MWATFTHVRELKLWGKCKPIMSHVCEWTSERGVHVHICTSLVTTAMEYIWNHWENGYTLKL